MYLKKIVDINVFIISFLVSFTCIAFVYAIFDYLSGKMWVSYMMVLAGIIGTGVLYWYIERKRIRNTIDNL